MNCPSRLLRLSTLLFLAMVLVGCAPKKTPTATESDTADAAPTAVPQATHRVEPDDPAAIAALEAAGFALGMGDGDVVEKVSIASDDDISAAFENLRGVPSVREIRLAGPGITDAGLEALAGLTQTLQT